MPSSKKKSGCQVRTDAKRRKVSEAQMSQTMSAFLTRTPIPDQDATSVEIDLVEPADVSVECDPGSSASDIDDISATVPGQVLQSISTVLSSADCSEPQRAPSPTPASSSTATKCSDDWNGMILANRRPISQRNRLFRAPTTVACDDVHASTSAHISCIPETPTSAASSVQLQHPALTSAMSSVGLQTPSTASIFQRSTSAKSSATLQTPTTSPCNVQPSASTRLPCILITPSTSASNVPLATSTMSSCRLKTPTASMFQRPTSTMSLATPQTPTTSAYNVEPSTSAGLSCIPMTPTTSASNVPPATSTMSSCRLMTPTATASIFQRPTSTMSLATPQRPTTAGRPCIPTTPTTSAFLGDPMPPIAQNDIAVALLHPGGPNLLPDDQKLYLLQQTVRPPGDPSTWPGQKRYGKLRRITLYMYEVYGNWLTYSIHFQGLFCKHCVFFAPTEQPGQLVKRPCREFSRLTGSNGYLHDHHFKVRYHQNSSSKAQNFIDCLTKKCEPINDVLDRALAEQKRQNRQIITSIAEVVVLCARLNSPFRGHRDDGRLQPPPSINEIITRQGNFRAIVQLYSLSNDTLKDHLTTCNANAAYVSKTIQNDLIRCMGTAISRSLAEEVSEAKFFTILADETTDNARESQLSLSLRYIHNGSIMERFVGFVNPDELTGAGLAKEILTLLKALGIDITNAVGQGYDGAAAMSSDVKGVQANIKMACGDQAVYVHCAAHALNLTLMKASEVPQIRNTFGTISKVAAFFNTSTVRSGRLQKELDAADSNRSKRSVKAPCQTRWVEKHEAVHTLYDIYNEVHSILEIMSGERGPASGDASSLLTCISSAEFAVSLTILNDIMTITKQLCTALQSSGNSLSGAVSHIKIVKAQLKLWRNDVTKFGQMADKAKTLLGGDELKVPRTTGRQTNRCNVPYDTPTDYYRKCVFLPFMDCLESQFEDRFKGHEKQVMRLCGILPKLMHSSKFDDIRKAVKVYEHLLQGDINTIEIEFEAWKLYCAGMETPTDDCMVALDNCSKAFYPNIHDLLRIFATLPVSTATPERTFSALKLIKSYLRSTMAEERLNGLALAYIQKDLDVNSTVETMVNIFASSNRRMQL